MSEQDFTVDEAGVCHECGYEMTPVRPGKAQCDFCEAVNKWKALAHQLAEALGHPWFGARTNHRENLLDFLDKKKAALAAYEEATK